MIELLKMRKDQWIIKRQNRSWPAKNTESVFVHLLAFGVNFKLIEDAFIKMELDDYNYAKFLDKNRFVLEKRG